MPAVGGMLICAFLVISLVGKSYLFAVYRTLWTVQMIATVAIVAVSLVYGLFVTFRNSAGIRQPRPPVRLIRCLQIMLFLAVASCCAQEAWLENIAFLAVHAGLIYVLFVRGAELTAAIKRLRFLDMLLIPLIGLSVLSVIAYVSGAGWSSHGSRLNGLYANAIIAGQMMGITSILLFWRVLHKSGGRSAIWWVILLVVLVGVVLTRTRTDIAATLIGMIACLMMALRRGNLGLPNPTAKRLTLALVLLITATVTALINAEVEVGPARTYLRLGEDVEETISDRHEYWITGIDRICLSNVFGNGPLDKFKKGASLQGSGYDRDSNSHNALFSVVQYYGIAGGVLFLVFLALLLGSFLRKKDSLSILGVSLLAFGLVQCVSENWLLSFGTPADVYSWLILGLTLAQAPSCAPVQAVIAGNKSVSFNSRRSLSSQITR